VYKWQTMEFTLVEQSPVSDAEKNPWEKGQ
jgi:hypothetical protein